MIAELERGASQKVQDRLALLSNVELLEISDEIREIVRIYIQRRVMSNDPTGDALHLALASFYHVDVLLTWNCQHLANQIRCSISAW